MSVHDLVKNNHPINYQPQFANPISLLNHWSKVDSKNPALIFDAGKGQQIATWTYSELVEQVKILADWLESIQHSTDLTNQIDDIKFDQVDNQPSQTKDQSNNNLPPSLAFAFENAPEVILLNLATWQAGWCSVPLDTTRDTTERKIYKLQQANCRLLFVRTGEIDPEEIASIKQQLSNLEIIEVESAQDLLRHAKLTSDNTVTLNSFQGPIGIVGDSGADSSHAELVESPTLILYTSGTTALPKGAVLTWISLCANAESIADWLHFTQNDRWLVVMPLHHINSTTFSLTTLLSGATIVLVPKYSKSHFWSTLAKHACTGTSIVPTIAFDQLSETDSFDKNREKLQQLTRMQLGSAPVQPSSVKQFVDRFGIKLVQGYGQTETSLRSTGVPFNDVDEQCSWAVDSNTLGTELKYTNVTILDDQGNELPAGEVGEICVRGPIIMQNYLNNPQATTEAFAHNWFHSGDTGYWQEHFGQKYFFLKGRSKEIIKKGGVLISPLAIENALLIHHPDLHQAYIIGFPDQRLGEQIGLIGVGEAGVVDQLIQAGKSGTLTGLEAYEFPVAGIQIKDDDLPKTSTGKIQRVELKNLYAGKLLEQYRTIAKTLDNRHPDPNSRHSGLASPPIRGDLQSFNSINNSTSIGYPTSNHSTNQSILTFRLLGPEESDLLDQAVTIDRQRWGETLAGTKEQFIERATHGVLIGCVDDNRNLLGTISALRINQSDLDQAGNPNHWTSTWNGVTGQGTLITNNHKGDSLLLVAVASKNKSETTQHHIVDSQIENHQPIPTLFDLEKITAYCQSSLDPVLSFHYTPKAGLAQGAQFLKLLPNARPADHQALGFCVLVQYPTLDQSPTINPTASIGTQLVEAALLFAYQNEIKNVFAYSRPVGLSKFILST